MAIDLRGGCRKGEEITGNDDVLGRCPSRKLLTLPRAVRVNPLIEGVDLALKAEADGESTTIDDVRRLPNWEVVWEHCLEANSSRSDHVTLGRPRSYYPSKSRIYRLHETLRITIRVYKFYSLQR